MTRSLFNNERLSYWFASVLLSWAAMFCLLVFPVFHLWLGVPNSRLVTFTSICCVLQLVITPWLFSARPTPQEPNGRFTQRAIAVMTLFSLISLVFFYFIRQTWPEDIEMRRFTTMAMILSIPFGLVILTRILARRRIEGKTN
jgi:hypothetical protein